MAKKIKKAPAKNKKVKKLSKKEQVRGVRAERPKKKNKSSMDADIIFDSKAGKTDALFIDEPKPVNAGAEDILPEVEPEKDLLNLDNNTDLLVTGAQSAEKSLPDSTQNVKKPWWKRIFSL
ncbi:MAG: hypothetical protein NTW11_01975 [Candidatus Staskawiczbacteria bacterium]|nr:hypothetical protein [Candidatus Staskawiczbacteria bacterium]